VSLPPRYYEDLIRPVIAASPWVVGMDVLQLAARHAKHLSDLGAPAVLAVGGSRGVGVLPEGVPTVVLGTGGDSMMAAIRAGEAALDCLPASALAAIDAFDPAGAARGLRALYSGGRPLAGRPVWGARAPAWVALEDKTVIDALWDAAGVARAPVEVVAMDRAALDAASARLDRGAGAVWAGDNRSSWHGGAAFTRWVVDPDDGDSAFAVLQPACDTARVMPFLEGVPCSIHGIVFDDRVVALRPCEMIVLRQRDPRRFRYAAASTFWDPPAADRDHMRGLARRVGAHLRDQLGYRGVFTIDGVLAQEGFLPTELNPRFGAAIGVMTRGIAGLPAYLLHCAIVSGEALDYRPDALEELIVSSADANRDGRVGTVVSGIDPPTEAKSLVWHEGSIREARDGEPPHASFSIGPHPSGAYAHANFIADRTPVGPLLSPRAAAVLTWADARYGLGLGPLESPRSVR